MEVPTVEEKKKKITKPWAVALKDERLLSFGGIWERWKDRAIGQALESFSIIATEPNEVLEPFHNRCPLIIEPRDDEDGLRRLSRPTCQWICLGPIRPKEWKVGSDVGNVRNNRPALIELN